MTVLTVSCLQINQGIIYGVKLTTSKPGDLGGQEGVRGVIFFQLSALPCFTLYCYVCGFKRPPLPHGRRQQNAKSVHRSYTIFLLLPF